VDNGIRIDLVEIGCEGGGCVECINLAQDRDQWRALVNTVMKQVSGATELVSYYN
jgi:hypothetical protein